MPAFLNGALLWGLLAVSVPIIIHLLHRRRYKVVRWAAMQLLLEAEKENKRRIQMHSLLVLLLRCLAVALAVLMVARPVASGALAGLTSTKEAVDRMVLVDDSASTGEMGAEKSSWKIETQLLQDLVKDLSTDRPGDLVTIIRGSRVTHPDLTAHFLDRQTGNDLVAENHDGNPRGPPQRGERDSEQSGCIRT